jgi:hypothetical protein
MRSQQFEEAMALRAAGLELVKAHGRFQSAGPVKAMVATSGDFRVAYRTPFQRLPEINELTKYRLAMHGAHGNLPYALDISHADRMVFLVEWDDAGDVEIILVRRGDWESKMLGTTG